MIKKLKQKKIKLITIYKKNLFPGAARNVGILRSNYEYIAFLDVNTLPYSKDWLKINFNYLIKKKFDGIFGKTFYLTNKYKENIVVASTYGKECLITLPGSIIKRKVFLSLGQFNKEARAGEDTDWLQRAKKSKFKFSNSKMPIYYKGLYNITYFSIIQKWFRNYYASKNLPHLTNQKNFYLFIFFVVGFVFVFNWNYSSLCLITTDCSPDTSNFFIPHITKIFVSTCLIFYTFIRGIYFPIKKKVPINFVFPFNFIPITFFSLILDLVKTITFVSIFFGRILNVSK